MRDCTCWQRKRGTSHQMMTNQIVSGFKRLPLQPRAVCTLASSSGLTHKGGVPTRRSRAVAQRSRAFCSNYGRRQVLDNFPPVVFVRQGSRIHPYDVVPVKCYSHGCCLARLNGQRLVRQTRSTTNLVRRMRLRTAVRKTGSNMGVI